MRVWTRLDSNPHFAFERVTHTRQSAGFLGCRQPMAARYDRRARAPRSARRALQAPGATPVTEAPRRSTPWGSALRRPGAGAALDSLGAGATLDSPGECADHERGPERGSLTARARTPRYVQKRRGAAGYFADACRGSAAAAGAWFAARGRVRARMRARVAAWEYRSAALRIPLLTRSFLFRG